MLPQDTNCKNLLPQITDLRRNINKCLGKVTKDQLFIEELWGQILGRAWQLFFIHTTTKRYFREMGGALFIIYKQIKTWAT